MITKKRIIILTVIFVLTTTMLLLTACGGDDSTSNTPASSGEENSEQTPTPGGDESGGQTPTAVISYTFAIDTAAAPDRRRDAHGGWITIDEDILGAIANDQGFKVELAVYEADSDAALQAVISGQANGLIGDMSITDERRDAFDFSQPYYEAESGSSYVLAVAKGQNAELLQMFDAGLNNIKANGKYQDVLGKYKK
jgi:ABC-type amino acid transport substrate-binding protein